MAPADIEGARARLRRAVGAAALATLSLTLLLLTGPLLDRRGEVADERKYFAATIGAIALVAAAGLLVWAAVALRLGAAPEAPALLLLGGVTAAAVIALLAGPAVRLRIATRAHRGEMRAAAPLASALLQGLAGVAVAAIVVAFDAVLLRAVDPSAVDLRHFSLHPWVASRLALLIGILAASRRGALGRHADPERVACGLASRDGDVDLAARPGRRTVGRCHRCSSRSWRTCAAGRFLPSASSPLPLSAPLLLLSTRRVVPWFRHSTVAARMLGFFLAFLLPALLLYPSVDFYAERAMRSLIATRFAVQAQRQQQTLQDHLSEARREIDRMAVLPELVTEGRVGAPATEPTPESAFFVWKETALARARLTSAIELYDRTGHARQPLRLELSGILGSPAGAAGGLGLRLGRFRRGDTIRFGRADSAARRPPDLRERHTGAPPSRSAPSSCTSAVRLPHAAVHHVAEPVLRSVPAGRRPGPARRDDRQRCRRRDLRLEPAARSTRSGRRAWPISDALFARIYDRSRQPFWTRSPRSGGRYNVYFSNDRVFIYAIGYPLADALRPSRPPRRADDAVGPRATCSSCSATAVFTRMARARPRAGRALLREIRASFYRKLFLAFVLASIIPVLTLAVVIRGYFADLLAADVALEATRTAAVAQRVIEQSNALLQRTRWRRRRKATTCMVWISQVIDQDVNIFDGAHLIATSERDLFASGLAADAHARRRLSRDRAAAAAELRRRGSDRHVPVHDRGRARARRRAQRDPHRAARATGSATSSARSTISIAASTSRRCSSSCSAPASGSRWPSASPIRSGG